MLAKESKGAGHGDRADAHMTPATTVSPEVDRIADAIPEYEVERELGRGGMGVVYLGRHRRLDRRVAIKELPPAFAVDPDVRERFSNEAQTLAGLSHPHIVPIFDYVERDGLCLIVMEALPGGSVWDRFTSDGLTPPTACAVVMACCAALQYAHQKSVLHLDVKPDNLMFDAESAVKVTDFGIARVITGDRTLGTVDGQVLGTPAYMSPEQARGDELTPASDVYASGVMLYELLSGQLPWLGAQSASELLAQRLAEDPVPLSQAAPHVPAPLVEVVMAALSRDVDTRYQRAEDLGVAIGEACVDSWGPPWLDHSGVAIFGSERLSRAARTTGARTTSGSFAPIRTTSGGSPMTTTGGTPRSNETITTGGGPRAGETITTGPTGWAVPGANETTVSGSRAPAVPGANETTVSGSRAPASPEAKETQHRGVAPAGGAPAPATSAGWAAAPSAPATSPPVVAPVLPGGDMQFQVVRAGGAEPRIEGADLYDLEMADLIGVEDVLDPPKPPWPAIVWTAGLLFVAAVVALLGITGAPRERGLEPDDVEISGHDLATTKRFGIDLSNEVEVRINDRSLAARADEVELGFEYLGVEVSSASAPVRDGEAVIDPGISQRLVGGKATAHVVVRRGNAVLREGDVRVKATQTWYLTAPFMGGLMLLLLGYANLESALKPLRSGRTRRLSYVGAFLAGPLLGLSFVLLAGAIGASEPSLLTVIVVAILCAAAGLPAVQARVGVARRRRVRQAVKRAEKTLGVTTGSIPPASPPSGPQ